MISSTQRPLYLLDASNAVLDFLCFSLPGEELQHQRMDRVCEGQGQVVLVPLQVLHTQERV